MGANARTAASQTVETSRASRQTAAPDLQSSGDPASAAAPASPVVAVRPLFAAPGSDADRAGLLQRLHPAQHHQALLALQRSAGNASVQRLLRAPPVRARESGQTEAAPPLVQRDPQPAVDYRQLLGAPPPTALGLQPVPAQGEPSRPPRADQGILGAPGSGAGSVTPGPTSAGDPGQDRGNTHQPSDGGAATQQPVLSGAAPASASPQPGLSIPARDADWQRILAGQRGGGLITSSARVRVWDRLLSGQRPGLRDTMLFPSPSVPGQPDAPFAPDVPPSARRPPGGPASGAGPLALPAPPPASGYAIVLHIDPGDEQHLLSDVGHVWLELRCDRPDNRTNMEVGFYPGEGEHVTLVTPNVPGRLSLDDRGHRGGSSWHQTYTVTEAQYRTVMRVVARWNRNPGEYRVRDRNCATFAVEALRAGGLSVASPRTLVFIPPPTNLRVPADTPAGLLVNTRLREALRHPGSPGRPPRR